MKQKPKTKEVLHTPVLMNEVLDVLKPREGESYLDLTAGYAGHASKIIEITQNSKDCVLVDRDPEAADYLARVPICAGAKIINTDYLSAAKELNGANRKFDLILADLGVSSPHLNKASRGFAIRLNGPLDMRMDQRQTLTAEEVVNNWSEEDLADIIKDYGEEPLNKKIAHSIVNSRPLKTGDDLAKAVIAVKGRGKSRIHPATKVFQAIRMAVNSEIELLKETLPLVISLLAPGGRIAMISFHSLEDREVKQAFRARSGGLYDSELTLLTKKPVTARPDEIDINPRARSAKLRAAVKIKKEGTT